MFRNLKIVAAISRLIGRCKIFFKNLKITTKVTVSITIGIFGILIISGSTYMGLDKIGVEIKQIAQYQIPLNKLVTNFEKKILEEQYLSNELIILGSDINSEQFKDLESRIEELETQTLKIIGETEQVVEEAIAHSNDKRTKYTYNLFLKEIKKVEQEQAKFAQYLKKIEKDLRTGVIKDIEDEKWSISMELNIKNKNIQRLIHQIESFLERSTLQVDKDKEEILIIIGIISTTSLFLSILFALIIIKSVRQKISRFQTGLGEFFNYLNRQSEDVQLLDDSCTDEMGMLSKEVNKNIVNSKISIDEDRAVINETIIVLSEFEQGDLCQRVSSTTSNGALQELTTLLNKMGSNMQTNIDSVLDVLNQYTNHNYLNKVDTRNNKEHLLKLAEGINSLGDTITKMLIENKTNGLTLEVSSTALVHDVETLNKNSSETAAALEETAAALEEITATVSHNAERFTQMVTYTNEVTVALKKGEDLANETTKAMDSLDEQVTAITESIILIDQIAFQTNILSGEAGKGFAVVAQEVRNLASRSADVAKDIKNLVESATIKSGNGKAIADNMIKGYDNLNKNIKSTISLIDEVSDAAKEQQRGIEQINISVSELDQQTQKNVAIASNTQIIAEETNHLSTIIVKDSNNKEFEGKETVQGRISANS